MNITLTKTVIDNINALSSIYGKVDIEVNGFDVDSALVEGDYAEFYKDGEFVFDVGAHAEVDLKVWKRIVE